MEVRKVGNRSEAPCRLEKVRVELQAAAQSSLLSVWDKWGGFGGSGGFGVSGWDAASRLAASVIITARTRGRNCSWVGLLEVGCALKSAWHVWWAGICVARDFGEFRSWWQLLSVRLSSRQGAGRAVELPGAGLLLALLLELVVKHGAAPRPAPSPGPQASSTPFSLGEQLTLF